MESVLSGLKLKPFAKKFEKLATETRQAAKAKDVHELRVLTRKLRTPLWFAEEQLHAKPTRRLHEDLRSLTRALGKRRKWDVVIEDGRKYAVELKGIRKKRKRSDEKLHAVLKKKRIQKILEGFEKADRKLTKIQGKRLIDPMNRIEKSFQRMITTPPRTAESRHELRIQVKKVRYLLEGLGKEVPLLKDLQRSLGREHDLNIFTEIAGRKLSVVKDIQKEKEKADAVMKPALEAAIDEIKRIKADPQFSSLHDS